MKYLNISTLNCLWGVCKLLICYCQFKSNIVQASRENESIYPPNIYLNMVQQFLCYIDHWASIVQMSPQQYSTGLNRKFMNMYNIN